MDLINWLQQWYISNCNGDWEHNYGIKIETIDNPGWYIKIDVSETSLEDKYVGRQMIDNGDTDWYSYKLENSVYEAFGDPLKLELLIIIFKRIVDKDLNE